MQFLFATMNIVKNVTSKKPMTEEQNNLDSSPLLTAGVTLGAGSLGAKYIYDTHMNNMATDKVVGILKEQADPKNAHLPNRYGVADKRFVSQANKIEALPQKEKKLF